LACKHQLAAKLASVLGAHGTQTVDDVLLGNMMMTVLSGGPNDRSAGGKAPSATRA
jgi:hypothetical protein